MLLVGAWYLDSSKARYEKWVDKKFPLPHRMRFINDENMKAVVDGSTLNRNIREFRSILMALLIATAFCICVFLLFELLA
jgi:hypothetical protein